MCDVPQLLIILVYFSLFILGDFYCLLFKLIDGFIGRVKCTDAPVKVIL